MCRKCQGQHFGVCRPTHEITITGPGIWAVSESDAKRRTRWQIFYNDALKGSDIEILKITLDPKFPMERTLKCRTEKSLEDTKKTILERLRNNPGVDSAWEKQEYQDVVIHGVTVPRGYTVASLGIEMRASLEKLNPGKLSPRNPVFLAAPMTKTYRASLRVSLLSSKTTKLRAPTPEGIRDLECHPYTRNRWGGGFYKDKEGYMNVNQIDAGTKKIWDPWRPRGARTTGHLQVQCLDCGKGDHESGKCKEQKAQRHGKDAGPIPPYGECFICGDRKHWAAYCRDKKR